MSRTAAAVVLSTDSRTTDTPAAAKSAESVFSLMPRLAACALVVRVYSTIAIFMGSLTLGRAVATKSGKPDHDTFE